MEISLGELVDRLTIVNIKIFHLVDIVESEQDNDRVAEAARKIQVLNRQRSQLKNEIDSRFGNVAPDIKV